VIRKASLGTIVFTVFLDLLGFGLVVPYLPGVARAHGASDIVATLLGASFSLMQLVFVPFWGQLSDRTGRRPVLLWSIAASVVGFLLLASADSLAMLFVARLWTGVACANLAVAQAYIADVTTPEERARGMGLIGAGIGFGFVLGPVLGGLLAGVNERWHLLPRVGALPAYAAAGLATINALLAWRFLPESLPVAARGKPVRRISPFDASRYRAARRFPGVGFAMALNFVVVLSFAAMEQTFRLFTADTFHLSDGGTGYVLGFVGLVLIVVQGLLIRPLSRLFGERALLRAGVSIEAVGFAALALTPRFGGIGPLYAAMGIIAFGSGLTSPSLSSFVSKCSDAESQGLALGVLQSAGAFARVCGPATGGVLYQMVGHSAPYVAAAVGMALAGVLSLGLRSPSSVKSGCSEPRTT
jgi:MFS transporter, DHA1 family, tetracycline resistance protein